MVFLFWLFMFLIFYAYIGYPLCLHIMAIFKSNQASDSEPSSNPSVSLLISTYNEEKVIEDKIVNSLSLNYPKELLEIIVVSDGSEDKTHEIVRRYEKKGVILRIYEGRIGKTACLNKAVPLCKGDIIVFSDANSKYESNAISYMVRKFEDKKVGLVTGTTKYVSKEDNNISGSVGIYSKIEIITKKLESQIGSCVGADGAIFAIRKQLYQPLKEYDINDFVIPLNIIRQSYRVVLEEHAFCIEKTTESISGEFKRQARITNRTLRAIFNNADMLNPFNFGIFSFEILSHKLCKSLVPYFMFAVLVISSIIVLSGLTGSLYIVILLGQLGFYLLAFAGFGVSFSEKKSSLISIPQTFTAMNLAIFWGWITYFRGETHTTWTTRR